MAVALLFILVIGMMIVGVPIAISLGLSSILFLLWHSDASLASVAQTLFNLTRLLVTTLYWRSRFLFSPQRLCLLAVWLNGSSVLRLLWLAGSAAV